MSSRDLDFIVIGAQKAGTTSLWRYLREHPEIAMPDFKEAPIFCLEEAQIPGALDWLMCSGFGNVSPEARLGKVATYYMMGLNGVDADRVVERIAKALPSVRLIALLRDPIERAMSQYRMSVRRGFEERSFDRVVEELMSPDQLELARKRPNETNSYLAQGEYGRILSSYLSRFAAERIHVEMTADLEREPRRAVDRILAFLGVSTGHRLPGLDVRHHVGGSERRLDPDGEEQLVSFMEEHVWPHLIAEDADRVRHGFRFFLETWNVIADDVQPGLSASNRRRLEAHYRTDAELLRHLGWSAPWVGAWGTIGEGPVLEG